MKNLFLLVAALSLMTMMSCNKDDQDGRNSDAIVGEWEVVSMDYTGSTTSSIAGQELVQNFVGTGMSFDNLIVNLKDDDSYVSSGSYVVELVTTTNGIPITQLVTLSNFLGSGTYDFNDPTIMFTNTDGQSTATVTVLDANNLSMNINTEIEQNNGGIPSVVAIDYDISLVK